MVFISISGKDLVNRLCKILGYQEIKQTSGTSHVRIRFQEKKPITIPLHKEIKEGTLNAIISDVSDDLSLSKKEVFDKISNNKKSLAK